ncbi:MAG: hypothetical protein ABMA02_12465 [Saprospiraceae bacterium]
MRLALILPLLLSTGLGFAQTQHPLLLMMLEKAEAVEHGSYRITASEQYPHSKDTIFYTGHCAFSRFEHFDGKPGIRYDVDMVTRFPTVTNHLRFVFDGRMKCELRNDTLALLYDARTLTDDYVLRGLGHFFFIPLLLHPDQVHKYFGPDKYLGIPPYETLGDTMIGQTPCTLVGAYWAVDTAELNWHQIIFAINKESGLPVYFKHVTETRPEGQEANAVPQKHRLEIRVEAWKRALPVNSFYIDWPSLPPSFEVRHFYDCYNRELLRPRNQPQL